MKHWKRFSCMLLALAMAASFWSCASSSDPGDTTTVPEGDNTTQAPLSTTVPDEPLDFEELTEPTGNAGFIPIVTRPGDTVGDDAETVQLRLRNVSGNWKSAFNQDDGCFAVAASAAELNDLVRSKLASVELDLSAYDDAFFAEYRLVLIPRSSNSGSVRYQAKLSVDGNMVHIELEAKMPEIGTADMAEWLVLVALPNAEYADMAVTVPAAGGNSGTVSK